MFKSISLLLTVVFIFLLTDPASAKNKRILVFSKTAGFHHSSINIGITAIQKLGLENDIDVDTTKDASKFTVVNLKKYSAVVFLNTTGNVLDEDQQKAFESYIRSGGGFVGIHSATDTEYEWPWYGKLVGAYFVSHPAQQVANLNVVNRKSNATKHLPEVWKRKDEWYNFKDIGKDLNVLIALDETSYTGGINGANHPMAWYHNFEGGRSFYTGLGHVEESYSDPLFLKHLLAGINYSTGKKPIE
ncbi:ThuA domain-containing protein [Pedobacter metabolipauper]|uniref:ThuA-like domain-containing protein n=1 Tax=Pedobacter metabolipauper TaxID=425513 RepID=A0A4R6SSG7_9SPHI|nr:ThuA domain-containing protein [Pedobacter metabolipauper]TDQ07521.1 hypothetical protein ATK78_3648 [Pedobacter metabolipauper]